MGFLSGSITFESFRIEGLELRQFGQEQIETLERFAIGKLENYSLDQAKAGFLAGKHVFDLAFDMEKNVIGDALHCAVRIDTNQIPAAVRKAWLQMELEVLAADSSSGRVTKIQRQEAKESVAARCEEEARTGQYRRMQQFPLLWDARNNLLHFGGSSSAASTQCTDLLTRAFDLEFRRYTAGRRAQEWATKAKRSKALDETGPSVFHANASSSEVHWWNGESGNFDYLGNEFLLWLWWYWETQSDTLTLPDDSEVTGMMARTLSLECPWGESGKETISAEAPMSLPESVQGIRSGKLPRKAGLILVRYGEQYELVLQAETFAVSSARIKTEETAEGRGILEDRIESVRGLSETIDLLFATFCERRIGKKWSGDLEQMRRWLKTSTAKRRKSAA
jgi:hypothetical protein